MSHEGNHDGTLEMITNINPDDVATMKPALPKEMPPSVDTLFNNIGAASNLTTVGSLKLVTNIGKGHQQGQGQAHAER